MNRFGQCRKLGRKLGGRSLGYSNKSERAGQPPDPMAARYRQRGAGRLKALVVLAIFAGMIYVAVKVIPVLVNNYEFQDAIESTARLATVNRQSADDIRASVFKEAQSEAIPIAAEDIHVRNDGGHVEISADYSVTVDLHVYQWTLSFHPSATNNPLT